MAGMTLEQISDRLEIQQLAIDYATSIDSKNFDGLDVVFTPDAYIDYRVFGGIDGPYPEVKRWLETVLSVSPAFQHLLGNADIRVTGDRATGRTVCLNPMTFVLPSGATQVGFFGLWYLDDYVRTPQGWRIAKRCEERSFDYNLPAAGPRPPT